MTEKQRCETCRWFEQREGFCIEYEYFCHGYDGNECERYQRRAEKKKQEARGEEQSI